MKTISVEDARLLVGKKVCKRSNKPFKSGQQINTVRDLTVNPNTMKTAFTFMDDDSVVDAFICRGIENL